MGHTSKLTIVAGSGRSGTTWLGNIIAGDDSRILFEPLDQRRVPELTGLELRPYFRKDDPRLQWKETIGKLITGEVCNEWIDQDKLRLDPLKDTGHIVVKEIRGNGILPWLEKNFPCQIIYLIRHPCAVIASRMKQRWETHLDTFLRQPQLIQDYLSPFEQVISGATTEVQKHAVMWCIENLVPLTQIPDHQWIVCKYEQLAADPEREAARILGRLDLDFTKSRRKALVEQSRTCSARPAEAAVDFLAEWQEILSPQDKEDVAVILEQFGIGIYNVNEGMPVS